MKKSSTEISIPGCQRSACPVASVLDIVGDKWTLIVVRDLFLGKHRFGEFQISPESIPTNILAERLKRLEAAGLIKKEFYQDNPPRAEYFLTSQGAALGPILNAMREWAEKYIPGVAILENIPSPEIRD